MLRYPLLLLAFTLLLASCKDSPTGNDDKTTLLTRQWALLSVDPPDASNAARPGTILEFKTDGTATFSNPAAGTNVISIRWSWLDDRKKIRFTGISNVSAYDVEVLELTQTSLKLRHPDDDIFVESYQAR